MHDSHLQGHRSELPGEVWQNCLGYYGPRRILDICCHEFKIRPAAIVGWVFQPCTVVGFQAQSDGGLDLTRMGFGQASVRKSRSGVGMEGGCRGVYLQMEAECCGTQSSLFPAGWNWRVPKVISLKGTVYGAINTQRVQD